VGAIGGWGTLWALLLLYFSAYFVIMLFVCYLINVHREMQHFTWIPRITYKLMELDFNMLLILCAIFLNGKLVHQSDLWINYNLLACSQYNHVHWLVRLPPPTPFLIPSCFCIPGKAEELSGAPMIISLLLSEYVATYKLAYIEASKAMRYCV
jgi:hypothetical protein